MHGIYLKSEAESGKQKKVKEKGERIKEKGLKDRN